MKKLNSARSVEMLLHIPPGSCTRSGSGSFTTPVEPSSPRNSRLLDTDVTDLPKLRKAVKEDMDVLLRRQQKSFEHQLEKWFVRQEAAISKLETCQVAPRSPHGQGSEPLRKETGSCPSQPAEPVRGPPRAEESTDAQPTSRSSMQLTERGMQQDDSRPPSQTRMRTMFEEDQAAKESAREASVVSRKTCQPKVVVPQTGWMPRLQAIVRSRSFESTFAGLIMANTLFFGVEVEYIAQTRLQDAPLPFVIIAEMFILAFTIELLLRLLAFRRDFFKGSDAGWNIFDALLVTVSVVDSVLGHMRRFVGDGQEAENLTFIRMVRILRTVRVFRVFRIMRFFRSLRILIFSVLNTLKSLFWTMLLLTLILYLFGIIFTQAVMNFIILDGGAGPEKQVKAMLKYYSSLLDSILTLFKTITGGVTWQEVLEPLHYLHWVWGVLFLTYVAFTSFAVLNVVTGVFCETAIAGAQEERDEAVTQHLDQKSKLKNRLEEIFRDLDVDDSGHVTIDEFEQSLDDERLKAYFESMDLTVREAWSLFKLLDTDGSHIIELDEFVDGCIRLRGNAKSIDIAMLIYESRWLIERFAGFSQSVYEQFDVLRLEVQRMRQHDDVDERDSLLGDGPSAIEQYYASATIPKPSAADSPSPRTAAESEHAAVASCRSSVMGTGQTRPGRGAEGERAPAPISRWSVSRSSVSRSLGMVASLPSPGKGAEDELTQAEGAALHASEPCIPEERGLSERTPAKITRSSMKQTSSHAVPSCDAGKDEDETLHTSSGMRLHEDPDWPREEHI